ncbi:MAG: hypothetical protein E4H02_05235 [Lentisphaerales bacterium]|jgi:uncharacterized membrane protein YhfC|nr:MAG: hypothetical protein E4H02_05235 [Lentisphaerales bacterium]
MNRNSVVYIGLACSLFLNVVSCATMIHMGSQARRDLLEASGDHADAMFKMQHRVLSALGSGDSEAIDALKVQLKLNMSVQNRLRYIVRTEAPLKDYLPIR